MHDYELNRFIKAQDGVYSRVITELKSGRKQSHWMWFVFPQIQGLGRTVKSRHYAIQDLNEARAYLAHPLLGDRLNECTDLVLMHRQKTPSELFGYPDDLKFHACMTLLEQADDSPDSVFHEALQRFLAGVPHQLLIIVNSVLNR